MGLLDILSGLQTGPADKRQTGGASGGMSPVAMALMGLLAYKAMKSFGTTNTASQSGPDPARPDMASGGLGGILGQLLGGGSGSGSVGGQPAGSVGGLPGGLGAILGGGATGSVLSSGLGNLLEEFQERGYGQTAQSWVGTGRNEGIEPNDLAKALGSDTLDALTQQTGMQRADLLSSLSQHLPDLVNQLTPDGRLPTDEEASRMV
jgi:uncharacterized protein YidB (DUF937 family)